MSQKKVFLLGGKMNGKWVLVNPACECITIPVAGEQSIRYARGEHVGTESFEVWTEGGAVVRDIRYRSKTK